MRILITGFTPFNNESINPSWEIAQSVHAPEGVELVRLQIPTEFNKGAQKVIEKIEEVQPNAVLSLGQSGGSACFNVEYVGINCRAARIPDNSGYKPWYEPVVQDGDVAYKATLPVVNIVEDLNKVKLPASVSFSRARTCAMTYFTVFVIIARLKNCRLRAVSFTFRICMSKFLISRVRVL